MGNRAVITNNLRGIGVYLHWNGGRDSVEAFLKYCELKGYRTPDSDPAYAFARLTQVISNFFGGSNSIGINTCSHLDCDNGDNGVYIIKGWNIVGRKYFEGTEQNEYDLNEMLQAIDEAQPAAEQLGAYLTGTEVQPQDLKIGDKIGYIDHLSGEVKYSTIEGIGTDRYVNGHNVNGIPYMAAYGEDHSDNINNYIMEPVRLMKDDPEEPGTTDTAVTMYINTELSGIELKFNKRPDTATRDALKAKGFKWHNKKALWYAKNTPDREAYAKELVNKFVG